MGMKLYIPILLSFWVSTQCHTNLNIGDRLFVVERGSKSLAVIDIQKLKIISKIPLSGNLRHASMVFDPALHYGYLATRNGILTRVNLESLKEEGTLRTSKNSIGIAISQDGQTIAVAEYKPGGITLVDAKSFSIINKISTKTRFNDKLILSRVTGLVDGLENTFICALMDSDEVWELAKAEGSSAYKVRRKFKAITDKPFDALITPEGRYYITGHFKSDRISLIDLWGNDSKAKPIVFKAAYSSKGLPTKMVHMESWAVAGSQIYIPSADEQRISVISSHDFSYKGSISLIGSPVYAMVHPSHKELWVTFSGDEQDGKIQIISTITKKTIKILEAGKRIYHMTFTPRGDRAFVSSNESNELLIIHCADYSVIKRIPLESPSGIFGVWRAFQIGL